MSDKESPISRIFEYPLKEPVRGFLRLESLFKQFDRNRLAVHPDNHYFALKIFFEILEILERGDTRSELIKELNRLANLFGHLRKNPQVDDTKLDNFLTQINQLQSWVFAYQGKFGDKLRKDPFLESVKYRTSIPGGACQFDCPDLYLFLLKPHSLRQQKLATWLEDIKGVKTSVDVILKLMRDNGQWSKEVAPMGSFMIETSDLSYQLLRVKFTGEEELFPEFSCGKHRSNFHFMRFNQHHRKIAIQREVEFELACCH